MVVVGVYLSEDKLDEEERDEDDEEELDEEEEEDEEEEKDEEEAEGVETDLNDDVADLEDEDEDADRGVAKKLIMEPWFDVRAENVFGRPGFATPGVFFWRFLSG